MVYQTDANYEYEYIIHRRHTTGAKVRGGEGKSPDRRLRSQSYV